MTQHDDKNQTTSVLAIYTLMRVSVMQSLFELPFRPENNQKKDYKCSLFL